MLIGLDRAEMRRRAEFVNAATADISSTTQVSLVPPPWLELTTSEPSFSATRVRPPGTTRMPSRPTARKAADRHGAARCLASNEVGQVDSASVGWAMKLSGSLRQLLAEVLDLRLGRMRTDQHAVAAGAVDLLHHQFAEMVENIRQRLGLAAAPGRHIFQDRLFAKIEADDLRHVGVDRLVVGDAGADCIGQRHIARIIGAHEAGDAERGVGAEGERIEEVVVDAAIDDVDATAALRSCAYRRCRRARRGRGLRRVRRRACRRGRNVRNRPNYIGRASAARSFGSDWRRAARRSAASRASSSG